MGPSRQRYGNLYYHPNISCITVKQSQFNPANLVVSQQVREKVTQAHSDYLQAMLGVSLVIPVASSDRWSNVIRNIFSTNLASYLLLPSVAVRTHKLYS